MTCMLSDLNESAPIMRSKVLLAVWTLGILLNKLNYFTLLDFSILINHPDELNLHLESFRVRLCPYEFGVFEL